MIDPEHDLPIQKRLKRLRSAAETVRNTGPHHTSVQAIAEKYTVPAIHPSSVTKSEMICSA
jgi:hypothetical protein